MPRQETLQIYAGTLNDTHIRSSIAMITDAAGLAGSGYAAVLGCGRCPEIPLYHLSKVFNRLDLVDLDADALKAIETQCQSRRKTENSYTTNHADLTGLIAQIEPKAQEIARTAVDPWSCLDNLGQLLTSITPNFWTPPTNEKYSLIVCSAVLTQLQASVRKKVATIFLNRFPGHKSALSLDERWRKHIWKFARNLEDAFINHLESLSFPSGIVYLSDTVHVCWLLQSDPQTFMTEGSWIATRTSRLADYLRPEYEIVAERQWKWIRREQEGPYWGRLYGVQAIIYRLP